MSCVEALEADGVTAEGDAGAGEACPPCTTCASVEEGWCAGMGVMLLLCAKVSRCICLESTGDKESSRVVSERTEEITGDKVRNEQGRFMHN